MTHVVPFRTRARTVDHLGREQIADSPTAVSELWKNAYDAYADEVALHIFDGGTSGKTKAVAAIVDNGHGMSQEEFIERWLVLGTEAKIAEIDIPETDRNGLPKRVRQGQKGIGRLSVASLGPLTLVLTKRKSTPITAALVDWRLFENPFLNLEDVFIPVEPLAKSAARSLKKLFAAMLDALMDNVWGRNGEAERNRRVNRAWEKFDALMEARGLRKPSENIAETVIDSWIEERHLNAWGVWSGEHERGTALFILAPHHELAVWTELPRSDEPPTQEASEVKQLLRSTLTRFTDLFAEETSDRFQYRVVVHRGDNEEEIVGEEHDFSLDDFHQLEHFLRGSFDAHGVFRGVIRAFGREPERLLFTPPNPPPLSGAGYVGPFELLIGTFEQELLLTTHPPARHAQLHELADKYSGIALYRDNLRIMPYGRPNADLFELERRRSMHAGREFWSHRRSFGRVALSQQGNPNLRDKAGREGLIDNQARRELKQLVIELLRYTALKFFGSDSEARRKYLPEIEAKNRAAQESEEKAKRKRLTAFRTALRGKAPALDEARSAFATFESKMQKALKANKVGPLVALGTELDQFAGLKSDFRLPGKPARLTGKLEEEYRWYRDRYSEFCTSVDALRQLWNKAIEELDSKSAEEQAKSALGRHQKFIHDKLAQWGRKTQELLRHEIERQDERASSPR